MDIRKELYKYYSKLYSQIQTIFVPLQKLINLFKDSVGKAQGIIIVAVKFLEGVLMAIRGAMIHLWERINKVMVDIVFVWMPTLTTAALGLMALTGGLASIPLTTYIALNLAIIVPVSLMNVIYDRF